MASKQENSIHVQCDSYQNSTTTCMRTNRLYNNTKLQIKSPFFEVC